MGIKSIYKALAPLKNRIHIDTAVSVVTAGFAAACALAFALSLVSLFLPVAFLIGKMLWAGAACLTVSVIATLFLRPGATRTIITADSLGLKERFITAYELRGDESPIAAMQRADALKTAANADFRSLYPIRPPKKQIAAIISFLLLASALFLIPSGARDKASQIEKFRKEITAQSKKLEEEKKDAERKTGLDAKKTEEIDKRLDALLSELKKAKTGDDALKSLSRAKNDLADLKKNMGSLSKLADTLSRNAATKKLADAVKNRDSDEIKRKLAELKNKIARLGGDERKKLAEDLKKASQSAADSKELSKKLSDLSSAVASNNENSIARELSGVESSLGSFAQNAGKQDDAGSQSIDRLMASLSDARRKVEEAAGDGGSQSLEAFGQSEGQEPGDASDSGSGWQQGDGENQGQGDEQGDGQGQDGSQGQGDGNQGQGDGQGNGTGNGQGNGSQGRSNGGGGGAGKGSTNKDAGYSGDDSGYASRDRGDKTVKDYESIYVPDRLGGDSQISQVKGRKGAGGRSQWTQDDSAPVEKGSMTPYGQVLGKYKNEAISGLQDGSIPPVMKDIVRDYFTSLD